MRSMTYTEFRRRYIALLRWFFGTRAYDFHALLGTHGVIVSGSVALAFFCWTDTWEPGDMDLYVGDASFTAFIHDLEQNQLATSAIDIAPRPSPRHYRGMKDVRRYITATGQHLDVVRSATDNPAHPLLFFWSSIVVNFLTPQAAVCVFPSPTLAHKGFVTDLSNYPKLLEAQDKYKDRGFTFTEVQSWHPSSPSDSGDEHILSNTPALIIPFPSDPAEHFMELPVTCNSRGCVLAPLAQDITSTGTSIQRFSNVPRVDCQ